MALRDRRGAITKCSAIGAGRMFNSSRSERACSASRRRCSCTSAARVPITLVREVEQSKERGDRRACKIQDEQRRTDSAPMCGAERASVVSKRPETARSATNAASQTPAPHSEQVGEDGSNARPNAATAEPFANPPRLHWSANGSTSIRTNKNVRIGIECASCVRSQPNLRRHKAGRRTVWRLIVEARSPGRSRSTRTTSRLSRLATSVTIALSRRRSSESSASTPRPASR